MRFRFLLLCSVAFLLSPFVLAQTTPPPVISSISPSSGPISGGTRVVIVGANLDVPPNFACLLPCPPLVRFGEIEVASADHTNERVVVVTPPQAAGAVDVTLRTADGRSVTVPRGFTYVPQSEARFARVLLPILLNRTAGAHGSLWETELWIRNRGSVPLEVAPWPCETEVCPAVVPLTRTLAPGESVRNIPPFFRPPAGVPGRILYLTRDAQDSAAFYLRLSDVSRSTLSFGTEIPVIREHELRTEPIELIGIPMDSNFRSALRIYEMSAHPSSTFRVMFFEQQAGLPGEPVLITQMNAIASETGDYRIEPGFAQILDLAPLLQNIQVSNLRIVIEPQTPGSRFWAFTAVTNNVTQQVTTVTPQ